MLLAGMLALLLFVALALFPGESQAAADGKQPRESKIRADKAKSAAKDRKPATRHGKSGKQEPRAAAGRPQPKTAMKQKKQGKAPVKRLSVHSTLPLEERSALRERGIYSGFGPRGVSRKGRYVRMHKGIDVSAPMGSAVVAFNDGAVIFSGYDKSYGISMLVKQTDGRVARYAHMKQALASVGSAVMRGEKIGLVGRTGRSTGPHLHFELVENDLHVDPALHVWDSTELVLRPGDLDPGASIGDDQMAALSQGYDSGRH